MFLLSPFAVAAGPGDRSLTAANADRNSSAGFEELCCRRGVGVRRGRRSQIGASHGPGRRKGEVPGGEVLADNPWEGCVTDPDAGHGRHDLGKRVHRHEFLDFFGHLRTLLQQRHELRGNAGQDGAGGVGPSDDYDLRRECGQDLPGSGDVRIGGLPGRGDGVRQ